MMLSEFKLIFMIRSFLVELFGGGLLIRAAFKIGGPKLVLGGLLIRVQP
jgi:hypothetical protein